MTAADHPLPGGGESLPSAPPPTASAGAGATPRPAVAFLGLGALGTPMAANLLAAGFPLTVHNRSPERMQALLTLGALAAASPAAAAAALHPEAAAAGAGVGGTAAGILCLCLSDEAAVRAVLLAGPEAAIAGLAPGDLVLDFSTIAPATSEALAVALAERGVAYLDAPVTGGTEGARAGTLSVLVGGAAADLERARPLLEVVGGRISHFGPVGSGQRVKAVNQVLVAGSYAAVAEAMALGQRLGLPMELVREALLEGAAGSWALRHRAPAMLAGRFPLGFKLALHHKDLRIALEAAAAVELAMPVSEQVAAIEAELMAAGHGDEDVSALARWFAAAPSRPVFAAPGAMQPPASATSNPAGSPADSGSEAAAWDARYREGRDGWELGEAAPPLAAFLRHDPRRPAPTGPVLVPGCGRGHEAALLAELGFAAIGLDLSGEALREAMRLHGPGPPGLRWRQADLLDPAALEAAGIGAGSLQGLVEHTCFCAIDPARRRDYLAAVNRLLAPGGWLLALFWCHGRPGGPPYGSDPAVLEGQLRAAGLVPSLWEPARNSAAERQGEWLGLWRKPATPQPG